MKWFFIDFGSIFGSNLAPLGPNLAQLELNLTQLGSNLESTLAILAQLGAKMAQDLQTWRQDGSQDPNLEPKWSQLDPNLALNWLILASQI